MNISATTSNFGKPFGISDHHTRTDDVSKDERLSRCRVHIKSHRPICTENSPQKAQFFYRDISSAQIESNQSKKYRSQQVELVTLYLHFLNNKYFMLIFPFENDYFTLKT